MRAYCQTSQRGLSLSLPPYTYSPTCFLRGVKRLSMLFLFKYSSVQWFTNTIYAYWGTRLISLFVFFLSGPHPNVSQKPESETRGVKIMYKFEMRGKGIIGKIKDILEVWVGNRRQGQRAYLPVPLFFPTSSQVLFPSNKCYFSFFVTLLEIPLSRNLFGLKASLL